MIYDTFMFNKEFDVLDLRLNHLASIPNLVHVAVEADVDHQDHPKPYHLSDNLDRYSEWGDRLHVVRATDLPTAVDASDPWARENAQREWVGKGLVELDAQNTDLVLHGDADEIPSTVAVRNVRPAGTLSFEMRMFCFAVDWEYPGTWGGTVATYAGKIDSFSRLRDRRTKARLVGNGGWHFTWLGGRDANVDKLNSFCHPEIADECAAGLSDDSFLLNGVHVDGKECNPVDVDHTWPKWIQDRKCPPHWFRPRGHEREQMSIAAPIWGPGTREKLGL